MQGAGEEARRDSRRKAGRKRRPGKLGGSGSQQFGRAGRPGLLQSVGPQVWSPRGGVGKEGWGRLLSSPDARAAVGRRVRTSDCLLNPLECPFLSLFFGPLVLNGLLYGHMCGN